MRVEPGLDRLGQLGRHRHADAVHDEGGVEVGEGAAVLGRAAQGAAELAQLG